MTPRRRPTKLEQRQAAWELTSRIIAFFVGISLVIYMTVTHYVEGYLVAAAVGMMGFPIVGPVVEVLKRLPGGKE